MQRWHMTIPEIDSAEIVAALKTFDNTFRGQPDWEDWTTNDNFKYAIRFEERLYPVKKVISISSGKVTDDIVLDLVTTKEAVQKCDWDALKGQSLAVQMEAYCTSSFISPTVGSNESLKNLYLEH
jgi:hypothetical protein